MDIKKEITEKIESGEFFHDARDWYIRKYLYNFIERSYLIILIAGIAALIALSVLYYLSILPIRQNLPIQVNITDAAEQYTKITYLGNEKKNFNINHVLSKYLAARFTKAFESYDYRNNFHQLKVNSNIIEYLGTTGIKHFYLDKTSFRNRDSLVLKYKRNVIREVFIDKESITLSKNKNEELDSGNQDYSISINFKVREIIKGKREPVISSWSAKINVYFEEIYYDFDRKEFNDLNFKVYGYESNKVKDT